MRTSIYAAQAHMDTPLGAATLVATERGLSGFWFDEGQRDHPGTLDAPTDPTQRWLALAMRELDAYWSGSASTFTVPLDLHGTAFQREVWQALLDIAHGRTCSYRDVAQRIGRPQAVRAVGGAIGRNPVSVIVPCHRVIGTNGTLTGYGGGLDRKTALLELEHAL